MTAADFELEVPGVYDALFYYRHLRSLEWKHRWNEDIVIWPDVN